MTVWIVLIAVAAFVYWMYNKCSSCSAPVPDASTSTSTSAPAPVPAPTAVPAAVTQKFTATEEVRVKYFEPVRVQAILTNGQTRTGAQQHIQYASNPRIRTLRALHHAGSVLQIAKFDNFTIIQAVVATSGAPTSFVFEGDSNTPAYSVTMSDLARPNDVPAKTRTSPALTYNESYYPQELKGVLQSQNDLFMARHSMTQGAEGR